MVRLIKVRSVTAEVHDSLGLPNGLTNHLPTVGRELVVDKLEHPQLATVLDISEDPWEYQAIDFRVLRAFLLCGLGRFR